MPRFAPTRRALALSLSLTMALIPAAARAHGDLSEASALSALPVAVSVAAGVGVISVGAKLVVVAVETSAAGTEWVLERVSDGARVSLRFAVRAGHASLRAAGAVVEVTVTAGAHILSVAGQAIALVPTTLGQTLLHHEELTPRRDGGTR